MSQIEIQLNTPAAAQCACISSSWHWMTALGITSSMHSLQMNVLSGTETGPNWRNIEYSQRQAVSQICRLVLFAFYSLLRSGLTKGPQNMQHINPSGFYNRFEHLSIIII